MTLKRWSLFVGVLTAGIVSACASKSDNGSSTINGTDVNKGTGGGGGGGNATSGCEPFCPNAGGGTGTGSTTGAGGFLSNVGGTCGGEAHKAEAEPVDMYIMFDQSSSMGDSLPDNSDTWWGAAQKAVSQFVNDPKAAGMGVGIQYFPLGGVAPASCQAAYSTPEVEVGLLPGNSAAIAGSINNHQPTAFTPTAPALQGAINHMKAWGPAHPGRAPIVVLVTDGFPTECDPQQITDIAAIAKTAFDTDPKVRTFVVGFNLGAAGENLKEIAQAGGTGEPFLINGGDIGSAFVSHMLGITDAPLQCSFDLPKPSDPKIVIDPTQVSVKFIPSATMTEQEIPLLTGLDACSVNQDHGWYFDSPSAPTKEVLCPGSCKDLSAGIINIVYGCKPVTGIPK